MATIANPTAERFSSERGYTGTFVIVSLLSSALMLLLAYKVSEVVAICCGALAFGLSMLLLMGDCARRFVYCFYLIQFVTAWFVAPFAITFGVLFLPLTFKKASDFDVLKNVPNIKPLLLMPAGFAISMIYMILTNDGVLKYYLYPRVDVFFMLGLCSVYLVYFLLKLNLFTPQKIMCYIAISGMTVIGFVMMQYVIKGYVGMILQVRFGTLTSLNPNIISSYLDLTLPCAFFTAFFEKRNLVKKIFFYALALIYVCVILMAATRASLPGIAVIVAYAIWRKRSKKVLLIAAGGIVIMASTVGASIVERMLTPSAMGLMSDMGRVELLQSAFKILRENHYFFGIGLNNFSIAKFDYGFPLWFDPNGGLSSHNFYVDFWLGWGLLGLVGWFVFNAAIVIPLIRKHKDNGIAMAVVFAVISYGLHGAFDCVLGYHELMLIYFSLLGIGLYIVNSDQGKSCNFGDKQYVPNVRPLQKTGAL